ncbi:hypothetical protein A0H81_04564 [Grifola frondosa]|uniref:Uncharacterized protein n=1 Tax=Grifola frondosa TaxID=5627 RepID=A0A1C7ME46_GRIFR|nr:hypothetical protein A0H81_04564 [Grifola frondosa]
MPESSIVARASVDGAVGEAQKANGGGRKDEERHIFMAELMAGRCWAVFMLLEKPSAQSTSFVAGLTPPDLLLAFSHFHPCLPDNRALDHSAAQPPYDSVAPSLRNRYSSSRRAV